MCKEGGRKLRGKIIPDSKDVGSFRSQQTILTKNDASFYQINQNAKSDCTLLIFCSIRKIMIQINLSFMLSFKLFARNACTAITPPRPKK